MGQRTKRRSKIPKKTDNLDIAVLIDAIFFEKVASASGRTPQQLTCITAIVLQLWQRSLAGSRKAHKLYMRYLKFVAAQARPGSGMELRYGDDMLTLEEVMEKHGR